jgi:hypothetical protein
MARSVPTLIFDVVAALKACMLEHCLDRCRLAGGRVVMISLADKDGVKVTTADLEKYKNLVKSLIVLYPTCVLPVSIISSAIETLDEENGFKLSHGNTNRERQRWATGEASIVCGLLSHSRRHWRRNQVSANPTVMELRQLWQRRSTSSNASTRTSLTYRRLGTTLSDDDDDDDDDAQSLGASSDASHDDDQAARPPPTQRTLTRHISVTSVGSSAGVAPSKLVRATTNRVPSSMPAPEKPTFAKDTLEEAARHEPLTAAEVQVRVRAVAVAKKGLRKRPAGSTSSASLATGGQPEPACPKAGSHKASQRGAGSHKVLQPGAGSHKASQPGAGSHKASQPGGGKRRCADVDSDWVNRHADNLAQLPKELMPINAKHGEFSYTLSSKSGARVEILVRARAYYVKSSATETFYEKPRFPWSLHGDAVKTWAALAKTIGW